MDQDPKKIVVPFINLKKKQEIEAIFQPMKEHVESLRVRAESTAKRYDDFRSAEIEHVRLNVEKLKTPSAILLFLKQEKIRLQKMIADAQENRNKGNVKFIQSVIAEVLDKKIEAYEEEVKLEKEKAILVMPPVSQENVIQQPLPAQRRRTKSDAPVTSRQTTRGKMSFILRAFNEDKKYFSRQHKIVAEVLHRLKAGDKSFFDPKTSTGQFQAILSGEIIKRPDRISWTGSLYELSQFVKLLDYELEIILPLKNDIWLTTAHCFIHKGKEILPDQVRSANGSQRRIPELKAILLKLTAQHSAISPES